jgi:hypothetical protein
MRVRVKHCQAGLALICISGLIAGCSGSSTNSSSVAQIRTLDETTNGVNVTVLVNNSATFGQQTLTSPTPSYLFINHGLSQFSYTTLEADNTTSNLPTGTSPYISNFTLNNGTNYTAYTIGRPDLVTTVTTLPFPYGSMQDVVFPDTHSTPSSGNVNLRFFDAAPDAGTATSGVDITVDGTTVATDVRFGAITNFTSAAAGTHTLNVFKTGTSTSLLTAPASLTFGAQKAETIIVQEPTAAPIPSPTVFTYNLFQIEDN